jgi:hypothetical protein
MSGLNLQPNQSPVQWVLGAATLKVKQLVHGSDHSSPSSSNIIKQWNYTSSPHMSHGVHCDNFTFTLAYIYMPTHVHTHTHTLHMYVPVSTFAHTHLYKHVCMCSHTPLHTHTKYTYLYACAHLCPNTHIHVPLYVCICNYTPPIIRLHKKGKLSCQTLLSYILPFY